MKTQGIAIVVILLLFTMIVAGCSSEPQVELPPEAAELENLTVIPADAEPLHEIAFERETVYGERDGVMLGSILRAAVDRSGRVFLADIRQTALHLYNPDGSYNRLIGSEGEGPGEYRALSKIITDKHHLHLMDRRLNRITRYDLENFKVTGGINFPTDVGDSEQLQRYPVTFYTATDTTYLFVFGAWSNEVPEENKNSETLTTGLVHQKTGELLNYAKIKIPQSEVLEFRENGNLIGIMVPYVRKSLFRVYQDSFVHNWSENFLIKWFNLEGQYLKSIYFGLKNLPLDRNQIVDLYQNSSETVQNLVRNADMPDTWPVVHSFTIDDEGRIWARIFTEEENMYGYKVISGEGELLASFTWPENREISTIQNGSVYAFETDQDTGLRELVRYRYIIQDAI